MRFRCLIASFWLVFFFTGKVFAHTEGDTLDCRYGNPHAYPPTTVEQPEFSMFPVGGYFQPLLADPAEPRMAVTYGSYSVEGNGGLGARGDDSFNSGIAVLGTEFASFRVQGERPCKGYQFSFFAAAYALFDWSSDSIDLLNTDFRVGFPLTMRSGPYSARLRFYHQSSHLGDEFIIKNPGVRRENLSYEVLDGTGSVDFDNFRFYGGAGLIVRSKPDLDHLLLQLGAELRTQPFMMGFWKFNSRARPVYGLDLRAFQAQDWSPTVHLVGGLEFFSDHGIQRFRVLLTYMNGYTPYGQFFTENKAQNFGINFQFDM